MKKPQYTSYQKCIDDLNICVQRFPRNVTTSEFLFGAKLLIRQHYCSLILLYVVHHYSSSVKNSEKLLWL